MKSRVSKTNLGHPGTLFCLIILAMVPTADAAKLYKWIDENGQVRYTDQIPQSAASKQHQTLNQQGVVISTKEAARTPEEYAAFEKARKEREAREKIEKQERKIDQALLLTFSSEDELMQARDERILGVDSVIKLIYKSMALTQQRIDELENHAEGYYRSNGKPVPGGLAQNIEVLGRKNFNRNVQLRQKLVERNKIEAQYELDLARYQALKN